MTQTYYAPSHQAEFLRTLFSHLTDSLIELRLINGERSRQFFYEDVEAVIGALPDLLTQYDGYNVYVGVCPRSQRDGSKASIKVAVGLWADVDGKDFKGGKAEALQRLQDFPLQPTITTDTGNGGQGIWLFKEPLPIQGEADITRFEHLNRRLRQVLNADPAAVDLARVLRVPGTWNVKDAANPLPARILNLDPTRRY